MTLWLNESNSNPIYTNLKLVGAFNKERVITRINDSFHNISGNEKLHYLLSQGTNEMRMDMKDFTNEKRYVKYSSFNVGNEFSNYTVTLSGFSGDVGEIYKFQRIVQSTTLIINANEFNCITFLISNLLLIIWANDFSRSCIFAIISLFWLRNVVCSV